MTTLHELLKRDEPVEPEQKQRVDLRCRYSPIGISAVAAACRYNDTDEHTQTTQRDRRPR